MISEFLYMDTTQGDIKIAEWIAQGQDINAVHLIVFYDCLKNHYFPTYVMLGESLEQKRASYNTGAYSYVTEYTLWG